MADMRKVRVWLDDKTLDGKTLFESVINDLPHSFAQVNLQNLDHAADDIDFDVGDTITDGFDVYKYGKDQKWHQVDPNNYANFRLSEKDFNNLINQH